MAAARIINTKTKNRGIGMEQRERCFYIKPWRKELETGIGIVDEQHKEFLRRANKFVIIYLSGDKKKAVSEQLEFLQDYLMYHFQTEETFQIDSHYPLCGEHQAEHLHLKFQVGQMASMLAGKDDEEAMQCFAEFVNDWFFKHVLDWDLKFAGYYNGLKGK